MPDGFDPSRELESIFTLKDVMIGFRRSAPDIIRMYQDQLEHIRSRIGIGFDNGEASTQEIIALGETMLSRAYGKPRQTISVGVESNESQVHVYIPDNNRPNVTNDTIIEGEAIFPIVPGALD